MGLYFGHAGILRNTCYEAIKAHCHRSSKNGLCPSLEQLQLTIRILRHGTAKITANTTNRQRKHNNWSKLKLIKDCMIYGFWVPWVWSKISWCYKKWSFFKKVWSPSCFFPSTCHLGLSSDLLDLNPTDVRF